MSSPYEAPSGVPNLPPGTHTQPVGFGPPLPFPSPPPQRGLLPAVGLASAILLSIAALIVGIVALNRQPASTSTSQSSSITSPSPSPASDTTAADRALCEGAAPLIRESAERGRQFVDLGQSGTPERDAGIPSYQTSVSDWVNKIQPILDQHSDADPFLRRTLQRFIDDTRIYAASIRPGPENDADAAAWNDKLVAIGGPFEVCHRLGVEW